VPRFFEVTISGSLTTFDLNVVVQVFLLETIVGRQRFRGWKLLTKYSSSSISIASMPSDRFQKKYTSKASWDAAPQRYDCMQHSLCKAVARTRSHWCQADESLATAFFTAEDGLFGGCPYRSSIIITPTMDNRRPPYRSKRVLHALPFLTNWLYG